MNVKRSRIAMALTFILALLALYASLKGVFDKNLYIEVYKAGALPKSLVWGSMAQDIISIPLSMALAVLSAFSIRKPNYKGFIAAMGLSWYFLYAFGLYVIQGQYTSIYVIYLAIFSLAIYSMILGLLSFEAEAIDQHRLPGLLRKSIAVYLIAIVLFLAPGWLARMAPDIARHTPGDTYGVFIMDLCMVFPALLIISVMLLRQKPLGNTLAGIALFKGFTLCLAWAFAELTNPVQGNPINIGMAATSSTLTLICLLLFIPYMFKLKKAEVSLPCKPQASM